MAIDVFGNVDEKSLMAPYRAAMKCSATATGASDENTNKRKGPRYSHARKYKLVDTTTVFAHKAAVSKAP